MPAGLSLHTRCPPVLLWPPAEDWFGPEEDSDVLSADFFPTSIKKGTEGVDRPVPPGQSLRTDGDLAHAAPPLISEITEYNSAFVSDRPFPLA